MNPEKFTMLTVGEIESTVSKEHKLCSSVYDSKKHKVWDEELRRYLYLGITEKQRLRDEEWRKQYIFTRQLRWNTQLGVLKELRREFPKVKMICGSSVESLEKVRKIFADIYKNLYEFSSYSDFMWRAEVKQTLSNLVVYDFIHLFEEFIIIHHRRVIYNLNSGEFSMESRAYNYFDREDDFINDKLKDRVKKVTKRLMKPPKKESIIPTYAIFQSDQFKDRYCDHLISWINGFLG